MKYTILPITPKVLLLGILLSALVTNSAQAAATIEIPGGRATWGTTQFKPYYLGVNSRGEIRVTSVKFVWEKEIGEGSPRPFRFYCYCSYFSPKAASMVTKKMYLSAHNDGTVTLKSDGTQELWYPYHATEIEGYLQGSEGNLRNRELKGYKLVLHTYLTLYRKFGGGEQYPSGQVGVAEYPPNHVVWGVYDQPGSNISTVTIDIIKAGNVDNW